MVHAVPLDTVGRYSAISYHSGNPNETAPISINGVTMNIFANLAYGIKSAISFWEKEYPQKALRLWVDQICINQSDLAEKSHQVNFMREIYRRAEQVYVSMPVEEDIQPAFQWLTSLSTGLSKGYEPPANMLYQNIPSQDRWVPENPRWPAPVWDQVYRVLEHFWWSRSWVYQEFIVASRVFFLFSVKHSISWEELHPLLSLFLKLDTLSVGEAGVKTRDWVDKAKERYKYFTTTGLMERNSSRMVAKLNCDNDFYDFPDYTFGMFVVFLSQFVCIMNVTGTALLTTASAVTWSAGCGFFRWSFCNP